MTRVLATRSLQWGHDRAAVELMSQLRQLRSRLRASMGPQPRGRGIVLSAFEWPDPVYTLQWGHDRPVVELHRHCAFEVHIFICFNGATTARSWNCALAKGYYP